MDEKEAKDMLDKIAKFSEEEDDEVAHEIEDQFHVEVLQAYASGEAKTPDLAKIALSSLKIKFRRWYA